MIDNSTPYLSVVVIGRNEGARLRRCLESVRQMHYPPERVEIIYVDTASTDDSTLIAESRGAAVIVIDPKRPCAAKARNAGWRAASAPLILFLDGDTILNPNFALLAVQLLDDPEVAVVWGRRREIYPEQSIYTRVLDLDWIYPIGDTLFCGGDSLMRQVALQAVGGFDEDLIAGEEPELCRRLRGGGSRILHIDAPMTLHDLGISKWRQYWNRSVRTGYAYAEIADRFRNTDDPLWILQHRHNMLQGPLYSAVILAGMVAAVILLAPWPLLLVPLFFGTLAGRTAIRNRLKSNSWGVLFAYGLHSHIQHLPIFVGQASYSWNRRLGKRRELIEYRQE
jgi:cellulose synthase/poly-beta-1,6-N-acetylglucosamine synthase-like glycosyltransferase